MNRLAKPNYPMYKIPQLICGFAMTGFKSPDVARFEAFQTELAAAFKQAQSQYMLDKRGGRSGVIQYLHLAVTAIRQFDFDGDIDTSPLYLLISALADLDSNIVHPLLAPKKVSNHSPASRLRQLIKAVSVYTAELLHDHGQRRIDADTAVAMELKRMRFPLEKRTLSISGATVSNWRRLIRTQPKSSYLRHTYDDLYRDRPLFDNATAATARSQALRMYRSVLGQLKIQDAKQ